MGRPPKRPEDKRQLASFRLDPDARRSLDAAAESAGRSLSAELEARTVATIGLDAEGVGLINALAREIAVIQAMTGKRWHRDLKTWAAVAEMMSRGPIQDVRPDRPQDDPVVSEALEKLAELKDARAKLITELAAVGIAAREDPTKPPATGVFSDLQGLASLPDPKRIGTKQMCEQIEDNAVRVIALDILKRILDHDELIEQADHAWEKSLSPYSEAAVEGGRLYQDLLRSEAERRRVRNESYNLFHLLGIDQ